MRKSIIIALCLFAMACDGASTGPGNEAPSVANDDATIDVTRGSDETSDSAADPTTDSASGADSDADTNTTTDTGTDASIDYDTGVDTGIDTGIDTGTTTDECNLTSDCVSLYGSSATDCVDSSSSASWCSCGGVSCSSVDSGVDTDADTGIDTDTGTEVEDTDPDTDTGPTLNPDSSVLPTPPMGYRWILQTDYSDEFNGTALDSTKWLDSWKNGQWKGRAPALFVDYAISVVDGKLKIQNGILANPYDDWKYYGGAVTSIKEDAHFGYYESRFISSRTEMSSTFWLANGKETFNGTCQKYSQELDIVESIGSSDSEQFRNNMMSNTHFRHVPCGTNSEDFYSRAQTPKPLLSTPAADDYHTYGAWWRDATQVTFYADNAQQSTVLFRTDFTDTPFDRPMFLNMVTETYDWETVDHEDWLSDSTRNATYYEWVRSWRLVAINAPLTTQEQLDMDNYDSAVLSESLATSNEDATIGNGDVLLFDYEFASNTDQVIVVEITDESDTVVFADAIPALTGHGYAQGSLTINFTPVASHNYTVTASLRPSELSSVINATTAFQVTGQ